MENVSSRCGKSDNAPRLRFPEFRGEWVEKKLGEIFFEVNERKHPELPVLSIQQGIGTVFRDISERRISYDKANINAYKVIEPGDFIIHLRSFEGGLECSKHKGISSPAYKILRSNCIDSAAFKDYFRSYNFIEGKLAAAVTGIRDGKNIDMPTFWSLKINIPSLPEQKKIAAFFTLLDRRIQKQRQFVERLKTYKRGVMNKLFDKNIEFNKYLKWEKVDEIFKTINDKPYQVQSCSYFQNGLYDIVDQGKKEIVGFCDYNDKLFIDVPVIIYGDHTTLVKYREKKFIVGGDGVKLLKSRDSNINLKYLYYALLRYNIKLEGYKRHFSILKEVSLPIFEKCIQDEIAKIMTCIDSYIKLHENKLSSLLSLKSSLLQKMFI